MCRHVYIGRSHLLLSSCFPVLCRSLAGVSYPNAPSLESHQAKDRVTEETVICHSKPASLSSTESSDGGKNDFTVVALVGHYDPAPLRNYSSFWCLGKVDFENVLQNLCQCLHMDI